MNDPITTDDLEPGMTVRYQSHDGRGNFTGWVETKIVEVQQVGFIPVLVLEDGSGIWSPSDLNDEHGGIELVD